MSNIKVSKEIYIVITIISILFCMIFILNIEEILKSKYFFDSYKIINAINSGNYDSYGKSYIITIRIFSVLNFFTELYQYNIFIYCIFTLYFIFYSIKTYSSKIKVIIFNIIFLFLSTVYLIRPGKEILQLLMIVLCIRFEKNILMIFLILVLGGIIFREYLIIQAIIFISLYYLYKKNFNYKYLITLTLLLIVINFKFPKLMEKIFTIRSYTNRGRENSINAITIIKDVLYNENIIYMYINYIFNTIRLLFPIELIFKSFKYLPYIIFQLWETKKVVFSLKRPTNLKILFYSFILISGIFEPDFGSFLRHTIPYFIIIRKEFL